MDFKYIKLHDRVFFKRMFLLETCHWTIISNDLISLNANRWTFEVCFWCVFCCRSSRVCIFYSFTALMLAALEIRSLDEHIWSGVDCKLMKYSNTLTKKEILNLKKRSWRNKRKEDSWGAKGATKTSHYFLLDFSQHN